jgi:Septum formation
MAGAAQDGGRMAAPARMGTGAEPDQPEPYLDDGLFPEDDQLFPEDAELFPENEELLPENDELLPEEEPYSERRTGWFGIVVLLIAVLAVAAAVYVLIHHEVKPKVKLTYQPAAIFNLQAGQCFDGQNTLGVTVVPCSSPHEAEVFATFPLPESTWPGENTVKTAAQAGCQQRVAGYMNPQLAASALSQEYIYPNQKTWAAGVRTVVCDVRSGDGLITGSVRQP